MEANQNITMEPYNIEYYIAKYGTVENLTNDYIGAIGYLRMQYKQYEDNPRKGGRYRREKMEHIRQQAKAIFDELLRVSRAMKEYFAATPTETPQISTETAETTELSAEATKAEEAPKYSISERDGNVYVTFKRGVIRQCAKRCGVSCKSAEWNTIAQAYNGTHSDMGMGLSFFFDGREDAVRFAELVCNGDISGYYKLYMDKIIAEGEARKKRIAEKCAEYDAAQAYFAECMADEDAETVNVSAEREKGAERAEMPQIFNCEWQTVEHFKAIPNIAKLAKGGIIINGVAWHTEYLDQAHNMLARVDNLGLHKDGKGFGGFQGSGVFGKTAIFKSWEDAVIATIDALTDYLQTTAIQPPQSPETPQTVD